jgi:hypothetical protein
MVGVRGSSPLRITNAKTTDLSVVFAFCDETNTRPNSSHHSLAERRLRLEVRTALLRTLPINPTKTRISPEVLYCPGISGIPLSGVKDVDRAA